MLACSSLRSRCAERIVSAVRSRSLSRSSSRAYRRDRPTGTRNTDGGTSRPWTNNVNRQTLTPTIVEQLLPSSAAAQAKPARRERTIPRLSLDSLSVTPPKEHQNELTPSIQPATRPKAIDNQRGIPPTLFIGNASTNLTLEDFRRVVPRGQHIPGWIHDQGDIVKVIPYRHVHDLAQQNAYYLIFASQESASAYKEHVRRIHMLSRLHNKPGEFQLLPTTQSDIPIGYDDARLNSMLAAFTIISPDQDFRIAHVREPIAPNLAHMLKSGGFEVWKDRPGRKAYELRMTLDGPQLSVTQMQEIFHASSKDRDVNWSGGSEVYLPITKWTNTSHVLEEALSWNMLPKVRETDYRVPDPVYIVGFDTEYAAKSFCSHWHNQLLEHQDRRGGNRQNSTQDELHYGVERSPTRVRLSVLW